MRPTRSPIVSRPLHCPFTTKYHRALSPGRSPVYLHALTHQCLANEDPEHCHSEAKRTARESIRIAQGAECESWKGTCAQAGRWQGGW